jgi:uncharacterized protein (DUF433 family)
MKKLLLLFTFITATSGFAQNTLSQAAIKQYEAINKSAVIDGKDMTVYNLLDAFYTEGLNADAGEPSQQTIEKITAVMADEKTPNRNLLEILLIYTDQLRIMAEKNEKNNPGFQFMTTDLLARESIKIYGKVPVLIQIYQGEAFMVAYQDDKAQAIFKAILAEYPDCMPARVYDCMLTKDEAEKQRLTAALKKEKPNHWMVKQFLK